jgi:hypothetical protein
MMNAKKNKVWENNWMEKLNGFYYLYRPDHQIILVPRQPGNGGVSQSKEIAVIIILTRKHLYSIIVKAIVVHEYGEPEVMHVEEVEAPQPSDSYVLVKIEAAV